MARTYSTVRKYLNRLVQIRKREIPKLQAEADRIVNNLDTGTYRSSELPGLVIQIRKPTAGGNTSWKKVVDALQARYNIPDSEIRHLARQHRTYPLSSPKPGKRYIVKAETARNPSKCRGIFV